MLEHGAPHYMSSRDRTNLPPTWFADAIAELTRRGAGDASLLFARQAGKETEPAGDVLRLAEHLERRYITDVDHPPLPKPHAWPTLVAFAAPESLLALARGCWRRQLLKLGCQFYLRAIAIGDVSARHEFADRLRRARRVDDALEQLGVLIRDGDATATTETATILLAENRPDEAIELLKPWVARERREALALTAMAHSKRAERAGPGRALHQGAAV
ncbi:hypothetical protein GCM10017567_75920 [Amycolatopsis bullii]|uniref:Uncharacterized protein n=1 Tax=Amycolatopsis bullii TaxID=941987 RepID=A0ABQ3KP73_9PSEU|nr:hypothetical protein GCM10017567_75920 [Amycolatopsis bullii]